MIMPSLIDGDVIIQDSLWEYMNNYKGQRAIFTGSVISTAGFGEIITRDRLELIC
jgi:hypothetical protein